jgi:hypothetical protein
MGVVVGTMPDHLLRGLLRGGYFVSLASMA